MAGMLHRKISVAQIAAQLGRHRSTIHRESSRNYWHDPDMPMAEGYWHVTISASYTTPWDSIALPLCGNIAARRKKMSSGLRKARCLQSRTGVSPSAALSAWDSLMGITGKTAL
ncbi:MAG: helix-turn-helix domain-containing protein [Paracoccus sp. (in: a-proteobacteria)]|uniref:helix-turn-helix domain-containing protein n=1 Tax=Paracoccus sp. TaxID=267 RepID=UPI00391B43A4